MSSKLPSYAGNWSSQISRYPWICRKTIWVPHQYSPWKSFGKLAAEVPYDTAAELFQELTGVGLSDHTVHEVVDELMGGLTVLDVSPTAAEIQAQVARVAAGKSWRPILVLAIDGADVPVRPETAKDRRSGRRHQRAKRARWTGEWREAKGFRVLSDRRRAHHPAAELAPGPNG